MKVRYGVSWLLSSQMAAAVGSGSNMHTHSHSHSLSPPSLLCLRICQACPIQPLMAAQQPTGGPGPLSVHREALSQPLVGRQSWCGRGTGPVGVVLWVLCLLSWLSWRRARARPWVMDGFVGFVILCGASLSGDQAIRPEMPFTSFAQGLAQGGDSLVHSVAKAFS